MKCYGLICKLYLFSIAFSLTLLRNIKSNLINNTSSIIYFRYYLWQQTIVEIKSKTLKATNENKLQCFKRLMKSSKDKYLYKHFFIQLSISKYWELYRPVCTVIEDDSKNKSTWRLLMTPYFCEMARLSPGHYNRTFMCK